MDKIFWTFNFDKSIWGPSVISFYNQPYWCLKFYFYVKFSFQTTWLTISINSQSALTSDEKVLFKSNCPLLYLQYLYFSLYTTSQCREIKASWGNLADGRHECMSCLNCVSSTYNLSDSHNLIFILFPLMIFHCCLTIMNVSLTFHCNSANFEESS